MRNPACLSKTKVYALFASDLDELLMRGVNRVSLSLTAFRKWPSKDGSMQVRIEFWIPCVLGVCGTMMHAHYPTRPRIVRNENVGH